MTRWPSPSVDVVVPAHEDFVATIRALTRSSAVLADLSAVDAEELQMAVDEAATLLLPLVDPNDQKIRASVEIEAGSVHIALQARCAPSTGIDRTNLAWVLLTALDPGVTVFENGSELSIAISRSRVDDSL